MKISNEIRKSQGFLDKGDKVICVKAWTTAWKRGIKRGEIYTIDKFDDEDPDYAAFEEIDESFLFRIKPFFKPVL